MTTSSNATNTSSAHSAPLLEVNGVNVDFSLPKGDVRAVDNIRFSIAKGEIMALVGESGSGKSVTSNALIQLLPELAKVSGEALFEGRNLLTMSASEIRKIRGNDISMIFQEPMTSLNPMLRIGKQVSEVILKHRKASGDAVNKRVITLLEQVGIPEPEKRVKSYPHELSGGQRQRVMIAMALACEPKLLIADEPTTALDVTVQAQILALLKELQQEIGMSILFITHDLNLVKRFADSVCVMRHGKGIEAGSVAEVFAAPKEEYTRMLLASTPKGSKAEVADDSPVVLEADDVKVSFTTKKHWFRADEKFDAVRGISLEVKRGQTIGIVGESGSGKSTLGRAILQLLESEGRIVFDGTDLAGLSTSEMRPVRSKMQVIFQDPYGSLSPRLNVGEIISEGLKVHYPELSRKERQRRVVEVLEEVALDPRMASRYPHEFSGGQRQRIAIARALILKPEFLLLDEPTSALDRSVQVRVVELLREVQRKYGLTYVFISHDLAVVRALADHVLVMKQGEVVEQGATEQIFSAPKEPYTRALIDAAFLNLEDVDVA
ncbi:putative ABC transporter ATP-binding protein YejF [Carnimonas sp. R-84981]|uniref:ABC transporter ATP-binding protein n=1 Tax=Carnimonas bestiolae TaxID=3402172 RepID=UPI003EDC5B89